LHILTKFWYFDQVTSKPDLCLEFKILQIQEPPRTCQTWGA